MLDSINIAVATVSKSKTSHDFGITSAFKAVRIICAVSDFDDPYEFSNQRLWREKAETAVHHATTVNKGSTNSYEEADYFLHLLPWEISCLIACSLPLSLGLIACTKIMYMSELTSVANVGLLR